MTKKTLILAIAAAFSFATAAQAQVPPSVLQNQNRIQQEQQRLLNEEFWRQELQNALKRPKPKETPKQAAEEEPDLVGSCVNIRKILFTGNSKVSDWSIKRITKQYKDTCMSLPQINQMLNKITDLYIEKGYITSRAYMTMPQKRLKRGILEIKIVEGKLSKVEGLGLGQVITAFPFMIGSVLNLRDIEQGIDQLNRLPSNSATMDIKPDDKNEYSKLEVKNEPKGTTRLTFFTDNAGSESTGETRFGMRAAQDNLLGLNEQINMSYANSPSKDYDHRDANYLTVTVGPESVVWGSILTTSIALTITFFLPDIPEFKRQNISSSKIKDILEISKSAVQNYEIKWLIIYPSFFGICTLILMWGLQPVMISKEIPAYIFGFVSGFNMICRVGWSSLSNRLFKFLGLNGLIKMLLLVLFIGFGASILVENMTSQAMIYISLCLMAVSAGSQIILKIVTTTLINHRIQSNERATVLSVKSMASKLFSGIGLIILKPLFDEIGIQETFLISSILVFIVSLISYHLIKMQVKLQPTT